MSTRSLKNKLKKVKATLPPPPPPYEELPIEEWLAEEIAGLLDWYLKTDEEVFYQWLEELPRSSLGFGLGSRVAKARDPNWDMRGPIPLLPTQLLVRALDALPPHIEHRHQVWVENFPARERLRQEIAEHEMRYLKKVKTRDNGYGWWFDCQENYARLREKYYGFEQEWAKFYEEWKQKCERKGTNAPMDDHTRDAFIRICFSRGEHDREAVPD